MRRADPGPEADGWAALLTSATRVRLVLGGAVDASVTVELNDAIAAAANQRLPVEVDTRRLTYMDCLAMAALARLVARRADAVCFIDPPDPVRFLLEVTQMGEVVQIQCEDRGFPSAT